MSPSDPFQPISEVTRDYEPGQAASERPSIGDPVVLLKESGPGLGKEIETLLRKRLWLMAAIVAFAFLAHAASFVLPRFLRATPPGRDDWLVMAFTLVVPLAGFIVMAVLWLDPGASLARLRNLEVILFGSCALSHLWSATEVFTQGWLHRIAGEGPVAVLWLSAYTILRWFSLIVVYGMLVPNTWRRCAAVTGGIAAIPITISLVLGLSDSALPSDVLRKYVSDVTIWLVGGALMATYGSHKISVLRQEAFKARKFGQYQLRRRLGGGGMGEVYLAEHLLLKQPCAVKLIRPEKAGDPKALRRFKREVEATAKLTHWNTIKILDYGHTDDGTFYYAMEYLPGLSLEELVHRYGPLPPARAVHVLRQICGALTEAHGMGLIHRDIKPSNILACERGGVHDVAKLLDFGLVQQLDPDERHERLTQEGAVAGTPAFMSPEQAGGSDDLDARSDIYSLGAVAYYLLTGRPPFVRDKPVQVILAHLRDPVSPLRSHRPDVPEDLERVCLRCLEKDAGKRFPDTASLEAALSACGCTGQWTEREAAAWWKEHRAGITLPEVGTTTVTAAATPWRKEIETTAGTPSSDSAP